MEYIDIFIGYVEKIKCIAKSNNFFTWVFYWYIKISQHCDVVVLTVFIITDISMDNVTLICNSHKNQLIHTSYRVRCSRTWKSPVSVLTFLGCAAAISAWPTKCWIFFYEWFFTDIIKTCKTNIFIVLSQLWLMI